MAGITLAHAQAQLTLYLAAEAAVLQGQSYRISSGNGDRQLTRADLSSIREGIEWWGNRCGALSMTSRNRVIVPAG